MGKRISYYVSRKSVLTWLTALVLTGSAVVRIAYFCGKDTDAATVWFLIVLPVLACLIFVLDMLISGQERFYRTAIPEFMLAVYFGIDVSMASESKRLILLCWIAYLAIAFVYGAVVSGKTRSTWMALILHAGALAVLIYENRVPIRTGDWPAICRCLPDLLVLLGGVLVVLAMHVHLDSRYHPIWGDRSDGRKLRTLDPMQVVGNYIMPNRNGASNVMRDSVEITAMERYIREKRREGLTNFGIAHVFLAAYVRIVAKYPAVNRFYSGQQVFSRDDDIQFCMVVKTEMTTTGAESIMKLHLKPTDTAYDVYEKFNKAVEVNISGDTANAKAEIFFDGKPAVAGPISTVLHKEGGKWLVEDVCQ